MKDRKKVVCPYCGYLMPIERDERAASKGLWVKCKARNCGRVFEIRIENPKDK